MKNKLKEMPRYSLIILIIFSIIFVAAGIYIVYRMFAASTFDLLTDGTITISAVKNVERISTTDDKVATAVAYSKMMVPTVPTTGIPALVVSSNIEMETNQASLLASALKSPLLILNTASSATSATTAEVTRLKPQKIYFVGSTTGITATGESAIKNAYSAAQTTRVAGANINDVAKNVGLVLMKLNDPYNTKPTGILADGTVMIVSNTSRSAFYPIYAAGIKKYPVLYVSTTVPAETKAFIDTYKPTRTIVIGGTAYVSDAIKNTLPGAYRIDATDNYTLSYNILTYAKNTLQAITYENVGIAPATTNHAMILASPYMASKNKGFLIDTVTTQTTINSKLANLGSNYGMNKIFVFGNDLMISSSSLLKYANTLSSTAYTASQIELQGKVDSFIQKCPILSNSLADYGDTQGYQAISYYGLGKIIVSRDHVASLDRIIPHELKHIYDWRDNGVINWGENFPYIFCMGQ